MKKIVSVFLILALALVCCGCGQSPTNVRPTVRGIAFLAEISLYNEGCECRVTVQENGDTSMELLAPESARGLIFSFSGTKTAVSYRGLSCDYELSSLPEGIACGCLYRILNHAAQTEPPVISDGNRLYVSGETDLGDYRILLGGTGLPLSVESPENGFSASLQSVSIIKKDKNEKEP